MLMEDVGWHYRTTFGTAGAGAQRSTGTCNKRDLSLGSGSKQSFDLLCGVVESTGNSLSRSEMEVRSLDSRSFSKLVLRSSSLFPSERSIIPEQRHHRQRFPALMARFFPLLGSFNRSRPRRSVLRVYLHRWAEI
jgi:hypothetical protein